ncbi:hypothetical protein K504DRAFT_57555 [Pleomassaria siparia CBS 279.74]|uniref:Uncharacterized protein n=1 Tax=Pleomassaria siparia CBS 279.74 TaxID=1314801 RepID=A0A6G1K4K1_9PLEO|nr:hypothetical protein K504DRAFT_57555 [Pleomassaria siparia CBS 279.74]
MVVRGGGRSWWWETRLFWRLRVVNFTFSAGTSDSFSFSFISHGPPPNDQSLPRSLFSASQPSLFHKSVKKKSSKCQRNTASVSCSPLAACCLLPL